MYISKSTIVRRIRNASKKYKQYLVGKTFMFVYEGNYIEVIFNTSAFLHLTGVATTLSASNFYKHATNGNMLKPTEIYFDPKHPFDLANLKTQYLIYLYKITIKDVFIADNILTMTATYSIGITDLDFIICFGPNTDKNGKIISNCLVPYSFRIEEIENNTFDKLYSVEFVFSKITGDEKYNTMTFGNKSELKNLSKDIKEKLEPSLLE